MFLKIFNFAKSDKIDSELQNLLRALVQNKDDLSTIIYDLGKITQIMHVKLEKDADLQKQRSSKVLLHYRDRLEFPLNQQRRAGILRGKKVLLRRFRY